MSVVMLVGLKLLARNNVLSSPDPDRGGESRRPDAISPGHQRDEPFNFFKFRAGTNVLC